MSTQTQTAVESEEAARGVVLVVDDDPATRALVVRWLATVGMRTAEASSGEACLAAVAADPDEIDVILLDVMMPGTDGFEVLRRLKEDPKSSRIPILFLSASTGESDVVRAVRSGALDFLNKPFSGPILVTKVQAVVARARAERALEDRLRSAEQNATHDILTGLPNRRGFEQRLSEMVANSVRHKDPMALLLIDIDKFKSINDELGHPIGDEALKHLGAKLRAVSRTGDQAFRYGGEEFVLLLQRCDKAGATALFARLRETLREEPLEVGAGKVVPFSVSGGISTMDVDNGYRFVNLVARADAALYVAKRGGRDRVVVEVRASESMLPPPPAGRDPRP